MRKLLLLLSLFGCFGSISALAQSNEAAKKDDEKKPEYEVHLQYSVEHLTKNLGTWRTTSLNFQRKSANRQMLWGEFRLSNRNGSRDEEAIAGIYQPLKNKWAFMLEGAYSPTHKYVGKYSVTGEVEKGLAKGYVLHLGGRFKKYDAVKVNTVYAIGEKYWGNNRGAYTLYLTKVSDFKVSPTHLFQYNRYYGESLNTFRAAFAIGREPEYLGPGVGIVRSNTWSVSVSAKHWLTKQIGLNFDAGIHRQGDFYYRRGLSAGLRYRF